MQDLQLIGVHEDGEHLLLSGADDTRFRVPVDEALRAAIRHDRPRLGQVPSETDGGLRPREVQALIRAGASTDEAATRAGWSIEKVHRYEGPILAEREHMADLAQKVHLRGRNGSSHVGGAATLSARVAERLKGRGVEVTDASWDSWRAEGGPWTVVLTFAAGGRQRQASWRFDLADRTVAAVDDEARWLSEEVQEANGPIPPSGRASTVYDVEAEGGLHTRARVEHPDDPVDLMTAMRKRTTVRGRRKPGGHHRGSPPAAVEAAQTAQVTGSGDQAAVADDPHHEHAEQALPLDGLTHVPATASSPPAAHLVPHRSGGTQGQEHMSGPGSEAAKSLDEPADQGLAQPDLAQPSPSHAGITQGAITQEAIMQEGITHVAKPARREAARKTGRPKVPAWDEIMFGSRPGAGRTSP